uniref:AIG1-type G domain-containing protein n=1 Tax=Cyprinus carpio TaxID=7962 RepID=A0A8C1QK97_CYPCA
MDHTTKTDTDVNCIEGPRDQRPTIIGNKYFILSNGKSSATKEKIITNVLQHISGLKELTVEKCDAILVFCFIISRTGTDIDAALNELNALSESKPAVFIVLLHTIDPDKIVPDSSRYVTRVDTLTVDCFFYEDEGLFKCMKNYEALTRINQCLQPQTSLHIVLQTVMALFSSTYEWIVSKCGIDTGRPKISSFASELTLVLLGMSGPEKTAVEQMIFGREESQADTSPAIQRKITADMGVVDGRQVAVINTPAWFSSGLSTKDIQQKIQFCIRLSSRGPYAFLLVIPSKQSIEEKREIVKEMKMIFGERCWEKVMILFTVTDEQQKKNIQDHDLQTLEMNENQFHVLNISETGNRSQVSELLEKVKKIQSQNYEDLNNARESPEESDSFVFVEKIPDIKT